MTRLVHLSDLHFGAEIPEAVEGLVEVIGTLAPDRVLIGGDFTMRARRREWRAARAFLDRLSCGTLSIPGNHDIPGANHPRDRCFRPFARYRRTIGEDLEPVEVIGDVEVAGVNTARRFGRPSLDWSQGAVSVRQCVALPFRFGGETPLRAVMLHHPVKAPEHGGRRLLKRNGMLLTALETAGVDLLLAGHFHQSHVSPLPLPFGGRNLVLANVSTACSWRTKGEPPGFHVIDAEAGAMRVTRYVFEEDLAAFGEAGRTDFRKGGDSWEEGEFEIRMTNDE